MFKKKLMVFLPVFVALVLILQPEIAQAGSGSFDIVEDKLCEVASAVKSNIGRAIATLIIIFLGLGAFFGKANWGLVIVVAVGIAAIFGATEIAQLITDEGDDCFA